MTASADTNPMTSPAYDGLVQKKVFSMPSYTTVGGKVIKDVKVGWESYGNLNAAKDNVVLVPHHFSANSHVAGRYTADEPLAGYWDSIIGPGKAIDTNRFCVIGVDSLTNMNSKDGVTVTTGPASINPDTGKPYGLSFPIVTIRDFVRVQKALMDSLGIKKLYAAGGVSMGALQSYEWAAAYPDMVPRVFAVNATASQQPSARAKLEGWIAPIKADQNWNKGDYYEGQEPLEGIANALYIVTVDALHTEIIARAYGYQWADATKDPMESLENDFLVVQSIRAMSLARAKTAVDANNMLYMARANQLFVAGTPGSSVAAELKNIKARTLIVQARTDLLFPVDHAKAEVEQLKKNGTQAEFVEMESSGGHLSGVVDVIKAEAAIRQFLAN